jgi:hypothetical protein
MKSGKGGSHTLLTRLREGLSFFYISTPLQNRACCRNSFAQVVSNHDTSCCFSRFSAEGSVYRGYFQTVISWKPVISPEVDVPSITNSVDNTFFYQFKPMFNAMP